MVKAIIFDFDGVILDDASVKEDAFYSLFPKEFDDAVIPVLEEYARESRKIIIRKCIEKISAVHGVNLVYENYLEKYGILTQETILHSEEIKGASDSLNLLSQRYELFVLTATPDEQIKEIIEKRGFDQFTEVIGSNNGSKPELAKLILKKYDLLPKDVLYIGDGSNDLACAKELGFIFIGVLNKTNDFATRNDIFYKMTDLENLVYVVDEIKNN